MNLKNENIQVLLESAISIAKSAGAILQNGFYSVKEISYKPGVHNIVTEYDVASEKYILSKIQDLYPHHSIIAEESGLSQKHNNPNELTWIIDPLDGTVNFAHGIPIFSVSIACVRNNDVLVGVVYHPMQDELFYASKGNGAFLNSKQIYTSQSNTLDSAFIVTGFPYDVDEHTKNTIEVFNKVLRRGIPVRRLGSAAIDMAYVAAGRFDGFWEVGLKPWDVAAGICLVKEAGGEISTYSNKEYLLGSSHSLLCTNRLIHNEFIELLA